MIIDYTLYFTQRKYCGQYRFRGGELERRGPSLLRSCAHHSGGREGEGGRRGQVVRVEEGRGDSYWPLVNLKLSELMEAVAEANLAKIKL